MPSTATPTSTPLPTRTHLLREAPPARWSPHRRTTTTPSRTALTPHPGTTRPRTTSNMLLQLTTAARQIPPTPTAVRTAGAHLSLRIARGSSMADTTPLRRRRLRSGPIAAPCRKPKPLA
ncbi:protein of unknown function [Streptomyces murinus]